MSYRRIRANMKRSLLTVMFGCSYIIVVLAIRAILFSRAAYFYEWTIKKEIILIVCMVAFFFLHYILITTSKKQVLFVMLNNWLLAFDISACVLWIVLSMGALLIGLRMGNYIILEILFNLIPILLRILYLTRR